MLIGVLALGCLSGCGAEGKATESILAKIGIDESKENDVEGTEELSEAEETASLETETEVQSSVEETTAAKGNTPVFGDENINEYEGFEYLVCDILMTDSEKNEKTGKMERKQLEVFLPDDEYIYVSGNRASSQKLGVEFKVELEPYLGYNVEDYLLTENLDSYIEENNDPFYHADNKDLVISKAEEVGKDAVVATVEYCKYDSWDDSYTTVFETYYLKEFENNMLAMVSISINEQDVTGKTPMLLEELETFYGFKIDWDAQRAASKREDFLANGGDNTVSTGYFMFELPDGWAKDRDESSYDTEVYAPGGDGIYADCLILFSNQYLSYDTQMNVGALVDEQDAVKELLESNYKDAEVTGLEMEECELPLGGAVKAEYQFKDESNAGKGVAYFIDGGSYIYIAQAIQYEESEEDAITILEDILMNGQVRE